MRQLESVKTLPPVPLFAIYLGFRKPFYKLHSSPLFCAFRRILKEVEIMLYSLVWSVLTASFEWAT